MPDVDCIGLERVRRCSHTRSHAHTRPADGDANSTNSDTDPADCNTHVNPANCDANGSANSDSYRESAICR